MNVLDLFSGIGGFSLGLERAGMRTVAFCEIDPFCRRVLAKHWPNVPCYDDVRTAEFPAADIVVGGFPCQDVSLAGRRAGITGERSGLYRELVRALRVVRPRYGIMENVAALLSDGLDLVLGDLAESGIDAEWDCVPARVIGAPHERDRVWIVTHADNERCGEAGAVRHRSIQMPAGGAAPGASAGIVADLAREQVGPAGQPRQHVSVGPSHPGDAADATGTRPFPATHPGVHRGEEGPGARHVEFERHSGASSDAKGHGCGQGRAWRPPDSFAGVRDIARRNAADPYGAQLAFREGISRDAWDQLSPAERNAIWNKRQSVWPDEPALSGVDDGIPDWVDRVKSTGNAVLPQIPEIIGRAIMKAHHDR